MPGRRSGAPIMRDYLVIVDRGEPYPVRAPSSFEAWKQAIEANPSAGRIEVRAASHSLVLQRHV